MEFELAVDADQAAAVARLKPLMACREGRGRSQSIRIIWHDSPDHVLLAKGLTLTEQRGQWRLERLTPGDATWLPGQPPPVIAYADDRAELPDLPSPLAPLAAFDGRRGISVHRIGASLVTLTIEKGILRSVTAERPAGRVSLSGDEDAVRQVAVMVASGARVAVPTASLAAEAVAMANGLEPPSRHRGPPVLPQTPCDIAQAFAHILGHLTDVILDHVRHVNDTPEAVHQMRVAVRRGRSAVSIFQDVFPADALLSVRDGLEALNAQLGPTRDWDVFAEETAPLLRQALPGDDRLNRLIRAADRRRRDCHKGLAAFLASAEFRLIGIELAWFAAAGCRLLPAQEEVGEAGAVIPETAIVAGPPLATFAAERPPASIAAGIPLAGFAAGVLQHRWKKLVSAGKRIDELDIAALHGVRLRAKRLRYAAEMFATLHRGKPAARFVRRLSVLQQRLGVLNDGAVASHLLQQLGGPGGRHGYAAGVVAGFMAARAEKIRPRIVKAFERFRRQPVYWA